MHVTWAFTFSEASECNLNRFVWQTIFVADNSGNYLKRVCVPALIYNFLLIIITRKHLREWIHKYFHTHTYVQINIQVIKKKKKNLHESWLGTKSKKTPSNSTFTFVWPLIFQLDWLREIFSWRMRYAWIRCVKLWWLATSFSHKSVLLTIFSVYILRSWFYFLLASISHITPYHNLNAFVLYKCCGW